MAEWRGKAENKQERWQRNQSLGLMKVLPTSCLSLSRGGRLPVRTGALCGCECAHIYGTRVILCVWCSQVTACVFHLPKAPSPCLSFSCSLSHTQTHKLSSESTCLKQRCCILSELMSHQWNMFGSAWLERGRGAKVGICSPSQCCYISFPTHSLPHPLIFSMLSAVRLPGSLFATPPSAKPHNTRTHALLHINIHICTCVMHTHGQTLLHTDYCTVSTWLRFN